MPVHMRFALEAGASVDAGIAKGFAACGCLGGFVAFRSGLCEPFKFVVPAASPDTLHAAWYSGTFAPAGKVEIKRACAIVGWRDQMPFVHCHGVWDTSEGLKMGHMVVPDTIVSEPIEVAGIGVRSGMFEALPDPETNFTLFEPVQVAEDATEWSGPRVLLAKVRPNEDISLAIEGICSRRDIRTAKLHGIGSLNEVRFADGTRVESHATEVLIREGRVEIAMGRPRAHLEIDIVDMAGQIFSGELAHGDNPVCVTFELIVEELDRS